MILRSLTRRSARSSVKFRWTRKTTLMTSLRKATDFCNHKLLGSLGCMLLVDGDTFKSHEERVHRAVHELNYGGIAVNNVPPMIWLNANLTWGGCGETTENFVSGVGNFGNGLNFENVIKSVIIDDFGASAFSPDQSKTNNCTCWRTPATTRLTRVGGILPNSLGKWCSMACTRKIFRLRVDRLRSDAETREKQDRQGENRNERF